MSSRGAGILPKFLRDEKKKRRRWAPAGTASHRTTPSTARPAYVRTTPPSVWGGLQSIRGSVYRDGAGALSTAWQRLNKPPALKGNHLAMDHFAMGGFPIPPDPDFYSGMLFKTTCVFGHETLMDFPPEHLFTKADPVDPMTFWFSQPLDVIKENCDVIKIYMLLPVLIKPGDRTKCMQARLAEYSNLSVKELNYVELLEDLADLLKSVAADPHAIEGVLRIGAKTKPVWTMKPFPLSEALNWVLDAGGKVLHAKLQSQDGIRALQLFYTDYSFYIAKMAMDGETMVSIFKNRFCKPCTEESEIMKMMGNDAFAKGHFDLAVDNYSEAIRFCPNNHLLFSNRALCFTRMGKYEKALNDGKKAITLKYSWPKGHYRFCEALFMIGERDRALASNEKAQELCKDNPEGIRDLVQQHVKFKKQIEEMREMKPKRRSGKRQSHEKKMAAQFSAHVDSSESKKTPTAVREDAPTKDSTNGSFTENKVKDDLTGQNVKTGKSKARGGDCDEVMEAHCNADSYGVQMVDFCRPKQMFLPALQELVKTQVQEACTALEKQRCHSALGNFERLLDILQQTDFKKLHLNNIDCAVLQYGLASALLGIGQSEELTKAEEQFKQIQHQYSKERFNCLAVYGIGNVYFRQNRFSEALKQYVKSQTMVTHKIMPGVLNWPLTDAVIDESVPEKLKVILENRIEECKFPPRPDAVCRYEQCYGQPKTQIYFTDPDFKGFIRILCSRFCKVEFHICCWKKLKTLIHSDKVDKDFLKSACLTPDCHGRICHIVIYDSTGVVKCEFEDKTVKKKEPQKSLFKQKGNSNKKSKVKTENKTEHKKITQKDTIKVQVDKNDKQVTCRSDDKVNHQHAMPYEIMLAHIAQKEELLISGLGDTKNFQDLLVLWEVISREDLDTLALQPCSSASEEMALLLKYLYRLNNRVKSRVFLYLLGKCQAFLSMELLNWLIMIEDKGFEAAANFQVSNMDILKKLNTEAVANRWNATYGKYLNVTIMESGMEGVIGIVTKVEILQRFIWFLEENRGTISLHGLDEALDLYFTEMDTPYYNFKPKSVSESSSTNCIKVKNKHKKKKQKLPKAVYTLSGGLSTRSQEEDILAEEDMFLLNPLEPFIVPGFLRHDIEEFETTYEPDFGLNPDLWPIDNAEIVRETLYDYFSQILDECGPLEVDDDLLVGEYSGFPDETHRIVEKAGGLKNFLLESNRFAAVGERLGLQIHASLLDDTSELAFLNPTAKEFSPSTNKPSSEIFHSVSTHTSPIPYFQSPILINPPLHNNFVHTFTPSFPLFNVCVTSVPLLAPGTTLIPTPNISVMPDRPVDIVTTYSTETYNVDKPDRIQPTNVKTNQKTKHKNTRNLRDLSPRNHNLQAAPPRNKKTAIVAVQVDIEVSEQDVNTDPYQPFETQQGDILRMEKEILVVKEHLKEATEKYEHLRGRYQSEKEGFNKQIRGAIESHKIAKKELDCLNQDQEGVVKKWHQEKKENQEKIKAIKSKSKLVTETNERYSKEISEMKRQYDKYLENFIHICVSNFEKERSMVEKRTIDLQDVLADSSARAIAAEVKVLENKKESERSKLKIKALKAVENIALFKAMASSQPSNPEYPKQINDMGAVLASVTPEMEKITKKFEEKIKLVKSGSKLSDVLNIPGSKAPPSSNPAISQTQTSAGVLSSTRASSSQPSPFSAAGAEGAAAKSPLKSNPASKPALSKKAKSTASAVKSKVQVLASSQEKGASNLERSGFLPSDQIHLSPSKQTPFDQIIKDLQDIFPDYKSGVLAVFISEVRSRAGGTLGGMKPEEIIARVTEYILDLQAKSEGVPSRAATAGNTNRTAQPSLAAQTKQPWRVVPGSTKTKFQNTNKCAISPDEPCIICHDDLKQHPQHMLDCGHWFHKHCITKWLHTQSTCPTCRDHALLPEDFPALSGRLRTT